MERGYWVNVATETGMAKNTFYRRKRKGMSDKQAATTPLSNRGRPTGSVKEYAVYRGDDLIVMGTATECRSEEHTSELQSRGHLVCRLLLEKKNRNNIT